MTAIISKVRVAAAHEGIAELIVSLEFSNGGHSDVPLDLEAGARLMRSCGVDEVDELIGQSWVHVRDAISGAYNERIKGRPHYDSSGGKGSELNTIENWKESCSTW